MTTSFKIEPRDISHREFDPSTLPRTSEIVSAPDAPLSEIDAILDLALRASSAENSQPWIITRSRGRVSLAIDEQRARSGHVGSVTGPLTLGCLAESVRLAAQQRKWAATLVIERDAARRTVRIELRTNEEKSAGESDLSDQLARRRTNRLPFDPVPLLAHDVAELRREQSRGALVRLVTSRAGIDMVARASGRAECVRFATASHEDALRWMRMTATEVERTRDGLDLRLLALAPRERWFLRAMRTRFVHHTLRAVAAPLAAPRVTRALRATGAVGAIATPDLEPETLIEAGRTMLRVWLRAGALDLAFAPLTVGALLPLGKHFGAIYGKRHARTLEHVQHDIRSAFGLVLDWHPVFIFRVGVARQTPASVSLRRPLGQLVRDMP